MNNKPAKQRLYTAISDKLQKPGNDPVQNLIDDMENLFPLITDYLSEDLMHEIKDETKVFSWNNTGVSQQFDKVFGNLGHSVDGMSKEVKSFLKKAADRTSDAYWASRVKNEELVENVADSILENQNLTNEQEKIKTATKDYNIPEKWAKVVYYNAMAVLASRQK